MHVKIVCSCGKLISQCRCFGPKVVQIVKDGCPECRAKAGK